MLTRHPLHPAVVHFPVASWTLATITDLAGGHFPGQSAWLAGILLLIGSITAMIAMLTGLIEYSGIEDGAPALKTATFHMSGALSAFTFYLVSFLLRWDGKTILPPDTAAMCFSVAGLLCLCVTGWLGGKLVYTHGTGVQK